MEDGVWWLNKYTPPFFSQMECGVPLLQRPDATIFFLSLVLHYKVKMSPVVTKVLILEREVFGGIAYLGLCAPKPLQPCRSEAGTDAHICWIIIQSWIMIFFLHFKK